MTDDDVLFSQEGQLGIITLNRPKALNSLTLVMILKLQKQLELWKEDKTIHAVVVRSALDNAFCAGGDVRWLYDHGVLQQHTIQMQFFWHEYRLNHYIHHFGKPYISLMNGITMGGGVGISLHGSHPVASENFIFSMPESGIGFFPDIGASHLLSRCPGYLGIYLGLTGNRLGPQDSLKAGLVKYVIPAAQMAQVVEKLATTDLSKDAYGSVNQCLNSYAKKPDGTEVSQIKPLINVCFAEPTMELIKQSLRGTDGVWAEGVDNTLNKKSPLSLKIILRQLQKAKGLSLGECLKMDFDLVDYFIRDKDFYEGVRALIVDKDKNPQWRPARLEAVTDSMVVNYFERASSGLELIVV